MAVGDEPVDGPLVRILERSGLAHDLVPLEGGTYNDVFQGRGPQGERVIVKVAPPLGSASLAYESDLLAVEADYFRTARAADLPVPEVLVFDDGSLIGRAVLVMSALSGRSYAELDVSARQGGESDEDLCRQVAQVTAIAHGLRPASWPPGFGYAYRAQQLWRPTWEAAFSAMVAAVVSDADRYEVEIPVSASSIERLVARSHSALAEVTIPAMVHFDLWDGNLLVEAVPAPRSSGQSRSSERYRLAGIVDAERAMSADPLFEVPSLRLNRSLPFDSAYFQGYAETTGEPMLHEEPSATIRIALYTLYLRLVMLVEATPRQYPAERAAPRAALCVEQISQQVELLERAL